MVFQVSYTLSENSSIFMKVDVVWKVVRTWSSFIVSSVWHVSHGSTEIFEKSFLFICQDVGSDSLSTEHRSSEFSNRHFLTRSHSLEPMLPAILEKCELQMLFDGVRS